MRPSMAAGRFTRDEVKEGLPDKNNKNKAESFPESDSGKRAGAGNGTGGLAGRRFRRVIPGYGEESAQDSPRVGIVLPGAKPHLCTMRRS